MEKFKKGCFISIFVISLLLNIFLFAMIALSGPSDMHFCIKGTKEDLRDTLRHRGYTEEEIQNSLMDCWEQTDSVTGIIYTFFYY